MIVVIEPSFDILISQNKKIMLIILARPDMIQNPFVVFDKKKTLALFRDKNEIIQLTEIPRKVLKELRLAEEILITEMNENSERIRQYTAKIITDSRLKQKLKKENKILF